MFGTEQLGVAADTTVRSIAFVIDVLTREGTLGALLLRDVVLLVAELRTQFALAWFPSLIECLLSRVSRRIKFEQQRVHATDIFGGIV